MTVLPSHSSPRDFLEAGVAAGAFPGAVAHLKCAQTRVFEAAVGNMGCESPFQRPVSLETGYDLASLTKIYTLAVALSVLREAKIPLKTSLRDFFPAFEASINLELLMSHRSGIGFPLQHLENAAAENWMARIAAAPLQSTPGSEVFYSCTNYFLLARVIEAVSGTAVDELIEKRILRPLQLENTGFAPLDLEVVAPTERKGHGFGFYHGEVHDEAARSWRLQTGTCAGNAGLFASAQDVARFGALWLHAGEAILHPDDIKRCFATRWPENSHWRGLGWQLDAPFYMSDSAPASTAGHLGFTGPSLVLHRASQSIAVILSNRVHPTRFGPDRLPFYREIMRCLFASHQFSN